LQKSPLRVKIMFSDLLNYSPHPKVQPICLKYRMV
jgi:hypothetical protein